jgi:hypothetical protein
MASGDMEQAAELSQQATSYLQDEGPYYSSTYFRSIVALDDSISSILSGDTQKAIESLRATTQDCPAGEQSIRDDHCRLRTG